MIWAEPARVRGASVSHTPPPYRAVQPRMPALPLRVMEQSLAELMPPPWSARQPTMLPPCMSRVQPEARVTPPPMPVGLLPPVMTPPFTSLMCSPAASSAARVHRAWEVSNLCTAPGSLSRMVRELRSAAIMTLLLLLALLNTLPLRSRVTLPWTIRLPVMSPISLALRVEESLILLCTVARSCSEKIW